jgi:ribosomal protein S18 acetylase RimI-like enzyme
MRQLVESASSATWIAEEAGRMAGFAIGVWRRQGGVGAYIQTIEVAAESRGRGVGRELLSRVEGSALSVGASDISLHVDAENLAAIRLYESTGYVRTLRVEDYYAPGRAALAYAKDLRPVQSPLTGPGTT